MVRRLAAFFMAFLLCLSMAVPSFASVETYVDDISYSRTVATPSEAVPMLMSSDTVAYAASHTTSDYGAIYAYSQGSYGISSGDVTSGSFTVVSGSSSYWYYFDINSWPSHFVVLDIVVPTSVKEVTLSGRFQDGTPTGDVTVPVDLYRSPSDRTHVLLPLTFVDLAPLDLNVVVNTASADGLVLTASMKDYHHIGMQYLDFYYDDSDVQPVFWFADACGISSIPLNSVMLNSYFDVNKAVWYGYKLVVPSFEDYDTSYLFRGFEYDFYFDCYGFAPDDILIVYDDSNYYGDLVQVDEYVYKLTFTPGFDMDLSDVYFVFWNDYKDATTVWTTGYLSDVESSYIPKGDPDTHTQTIASDTSVIKKTVSKISEKISSLSSTVVQVVSNAVESITKNDDKNVAEIIASDEKLQQEQLENDDKNADAIMNSYDKSGFDDSNGKLGDSIVQQQDQEQQIMDQISEPLDSFEFKDPIAQYLSTFKLFGDFLQDLFTNSGAFSDVINLSFIMGIALMVAGLYRFKGGN